MNTRPYTEIHTSVESWKRSAATRNLTILETEFGGTIVVIAEDQNGHVKGMWTENTAVPGWFH